MSALTETMPSVWFLEYDALGDAALPAEAVCGPALAAVEPAEAPEIQDR
jgi:hypothetical protein